MCARLSALRAPRSNSRSRIVDVEQCAIATEKINEAMPRVRSKALSAALVKERELVAVPMGGGERTGRRRRKPSGATLLLRHAREGVCTAGQSIVTETVGNLTLSFKAGDFFQNNPYTLPLLVDHVIRNAKGDAPSGDQPKDVRYMIDAYCGSGLFALSAADAFEEVVGVETSTTAVEFATRNAAANGIANARFIAGSAECIFEQVRGPPWAFRDGVARPAPLIPAQVPFPGAQTVCVLDPPRKGCDRLFLSQLLSYAPRRIVYVSCRAETLARDLVVLAGAGYALRHVRPFDMFPQTRHIEAVATLEWPDELSDPAPDTDGLIYPDG